MNGIVKKVVKDRYYGFIRANSSGVEYFFHADDFKGHWKDLEADAENKNNFVPVEFEVVESAKGPRAANVRRTDYPNQAV